MAPGAAKKQEPYQALADELRSRRGIECHAAVLGTERVEYFRSKDFSAFFQEHPEKMLQGMVPGTSASKKPADLSEAVREVLHLLMRRGLVMRADRLYKKPRPGRKRLSKWPRKLALVPVQDQRWADDAFYIWTYELPTSPWFYVGAGALVLLVLMLCLFPLAPYQIKIAVVYISLTIVALILGTIALRGGVAFVTWLLAGRALWLLPNMLSETVGLDQAFWPLYELDEVAKDWWWGSGMPLRLAMGATSVALVWGLATVSPGKGDLTAGAKATHDQILDWLNLQDAQFARLEGMNATEAAAAAEAKAAAGGQVQRQPMGGGAGGLGVGGILQKSAAQEVAARMAAMKAAFNASSTVPDEPVPEYNELLEEEVRELEAELAAQEGALREVQAGAAAAEAAGEHQATLLWQAKQVAADQAHSAAEAGLAAARAALAAVAEAPAAGGGREAAERAVLEAVEAAAAAKRDPTVEEGIDVGVESHATAGSYEAARERASSMAAAAAEEYQRKHAEAQAQGQDRAEL